MWWPSLLQKIIIRIHNINHIYKYFSNHYICPYLYLIRRVHNLIPRVHNILKIKIYNFYCGWIPWIWQRITFSLRKITPVNPGILVSHFILRRKRQLIIIDETKLILDALFEIAVDWDLENYRVQKPKCGLRKTICNSKEFSFMLPQIAFVINEAMVLSLLVWFFMENRSVKNPMGRSQPRAIVRVVLVS